MTSSVRFVAIGDSFTEGVGDELPDGRVRGWADIAAQGWADAAGEPIEYANLAIRGKLIEPIVAEQLEPALALKPTHLSFNGGGNDMLRPRTSIAQVADLFAHVLRRCDEEGVTLLALSGANPSGQLPLAPRHPAPRRPAVGRRRAAAGASAGRRHRVELARSRAQHAALLVCGPACT
ncbi:SGNH/GDSL hydrolase family protein [Microbacterium elymi]|uniref:SGNH/GDSL hydrolase family protein n=1 Tax=Microbacterium elymi TaxID=2909587 RepID=A0ABY5NJW1_9MICO|nr:SGNH/GDSL hydrolase family protein [Microbacterium elymi]UUT35414.1 SGNH/GDSL hydrolase family protein [Microbacterium elymi]